MLNHEYTLSFFIAGHETTAGAVTWCLYALSQNKEAQHKLREELLSVESDTLSMDDLMALPYLDNVLRETLRVHPPVTNSIRQATKDDFIPLSKPYTDIYGEVHQFVQSVAPYTGAIRLADTPYFCFQS